MKKNILFPFVVIGILGSLIYYNFYYGKDTVNNVDNNKNENVDNYDCPKDYKCEKIDDVIYKWSKKTIIKVTKVFNYDNDEQEIGNLKITSAGTLVFIDLSGVVISIYGSIEGKVVAIDSVSEDCENVFYIALTDKGEVYRTDPQDVLLLQEPFYKIEEDENNGITGIFIEKNIEEEVCVGGKIYAKGAYNKITELSVR